MFFKIRTRQISLFMAILGIVGLLGACGGATNPDYVQIVPASFSPGSAIPAPSQEVILTVSGNISVTNAGDTLQFDMRTLESLGLVEYTVDDPWLNATNTYTGVLMSDLRKFVGASEAAKSMHIVALDDYGVDISVQDMEKWPILLATRTNGEYMDVENSGPTRIIFPYHNYSIDPVKYNDFWIWNLKSMEIN